MIQVIGTPLGQSGYSYSCRGIIKIMDKLNINFTVKDLTNSYINKKIDFGDKFNNIINNNLNKRIVYKINFINLTPNLAYNFIEKDKINIVYTTWEFEKIPTNWIDKLDFFDYVFVPSIFNYNIFKKYIDEKKLLYIPHFLEEIYNSKSEKNKKFTFYSIGQWQNRKNFKSLLISYLSEFCNLDNVELIIKTYRNNYSEDEKKKLFDEILYIKTSLNKTNCPNLIIICDLLGEKEIEYIHKTNHCFVSSTRGEGFGLPIYQALQYQNPVIVTGYSSYVEDLPEISRVDYTLTPVIGMSDIDKSYNSDMLWADINIEELRNRMRLFYNYFIDNRYDEIKERYDFDVVKRMNEISLNRIESFISGL